MTTHETRGRHAAAMAAHDHLKVEHAAAMACDRRGHGQLEGTSKVMEVVTRTHELSDKVSTVSNHVLDVQRQYQKLRLEAGMSVEFMVKKRVQSTPTRATRKLTLEVRDGEPVLVNSTHKGCERNVLRVMDIERLAGSGALNIKFGYDCVCMYVDARVCM
jgi:hypothetical protein